MTAKKVSIIIPVYNASLFLKRCLDSIVNQYYKNFDVWMINDGSTDESGKICDEYALKYSNFNAYHGNNRGVSNARNTGISQSGGDYITFVDADDYISPDFLSLLVVHNVDISVCGCTILQDNRSEQIEIIESINNTKSDFDGKENLNKILNHHLVRPVWGKLFKKNIISDNNLLFDTSVRLGEDTIFVLTYIAYAKSSQIVSSPSYYYFRAGFKINKFKNEPNDIIFIYSKLQQLTDNLKKNGFKPVSLYYSNYRSLCNNFYSLLFLSEQYTFEQRKDYFTLFKSVNFDCIDKDFGISNKAIRVIYKQLVSINFYLLIDVFLKNYFRLVRWKNS